jgi:hypothetical protein
MPKVVHNEKHSTKVHGCGNIFGMVQPLCNSCNLSMMFIGDYHVTCDNPACKEYEIEYSLDCEHESMTDEYEGDEFWN